jgi:nucleoside-diphosphate-sugar epimerase
LHPIPSRINTVVRGEQPPPSVYADDGGDRCYAPDAGRAIALLMTAPTLNHDTYNVSSGRPVANHEFAAALAAAVPAARLDLTPGREPGSGPRDPYLDITRLTTDTGFAPAHRSRRLRRVARQQPPLEPTQKQHRTDTRRRR